MMLFALLASLAAAPEPGELRTFQDWTVGCDNGHRCEAIALLPEGEDWELWTLMSVSRDAGGGAVPVFEILNLEWEPASLLVDERALPVRFSGTLEGTRVVDDSGALLAALRSAASLEVRDASGSRRAGVSLVGATAALLFMDERQGRVGTTTALVRPGTRPATEVPPAVPLPFIVMAPSPTDAAVAVTQSRIDALGRETECADVEVGERVNRFETAQIATGTTLVLLACGSGAYNFSSVPYLARREGGRIRLEIAPFDSPQLVETEGRPLLVNAEWNEESRRLVEYYKGRGFGDCGTGAEYVWDGARFRLVHFERMGECRGSLRRIVTWRADVRP